MDNDMTRDRNAGSQPQGKQIRSAQWQPTDRTLVSVPNLNAAIRLLVSHGLFPVGIAIPPEELQARLGEKTATGVAASGHRESHCSSWRLGAAVRVEWFAWRCERGRAHD